MAELKMPRIMISAPNSGSGKTTIVCGILKALMNMGKRVAAFKSGPDYIDPMFHKSVLGIPSENIFLPCGLLSTGIASIGFCRTKSVESTRLPGVDSIPGEIFP